MTRRRLGAEVTSRSLIIVFASFVVTSLTMAVLPCAGVLFLPFQNEFDSTAAQTGAISSIMSAMSSLGSTLGGVLVNRFGCRRATILGGVLYFIGMVASSMTKTIYQMYALGAIAGLGIGVIFTPAIVIVAQYYDKYYSTANALSTTGTSVGILVSPPLMQLLLNSFGWRGALLITGAIAANACVAGAVFRPINRRDMVPDKIEHDQENIDSEGKKPSRFTVRNPLVLASRALRLNLLRQSYCLVAYCFSKTASDAAFNCFLTYLIPCAAKSGISEQRASFLISITGICSIVGRILCGPVNQKVSSVVMYQVSTFICACAVLVAQGSTYAHFAASTAILGISAGFQLSVEKVMMREFVGVDNLASAVGIVNFIGGVTELVSPIVAGALYDATDSYPLLFYVFAAVFFLGFLVVLTMPLLRRIEPGLKVKVATKMELKEEEL